MSRLVVPQVQSVLTGHRYNAWPLQRYTVTTLGVPAFQRLTGKDIRLAGPVV